MEKWLAHIFQYPAELQGTAPVFIGDQGTGKGMLCDETLARLCGGDRYYATCNPTKDLFSRFSNGLYLRFVVNVDETKGKESCANSEEMKREITAPTYNHEPKGVAGFTVRNCCRFIFTTNNQNPIKIEGGDRRYFILNTSDEKFGDKEYFDGYLNYIKNECNQKAIYEYLMNVDISNVNWNRDRPINESYEAIQASYVGIIDKFLINLAQVSSGDQVLSLSGTDVFKAFSKWCENNKLGKWDSAKVEFTPQISMTSFFLKLKHLMTSARNCGLDKKRGSSGVLYTFDVDLLKKHFERKKLMHLDYYFSTSTFIERYIMRD